MANTMKVLHEGKVIGEIVTNHSMTINEALEILGIDPNEMNAGDLVWNWESFELVY